LASNGTQGGGIGVWDLRDPRVPSVWLRGSTGPVRFVAFSPDGAHLASGGLEPRKDAPAAVRILDLGEPNAAPLLLWGHRVDVSSGAFSSGGALATAGADGVRLWNLPSRGSVT